MLYIYQGIMDLDELSYNAFYLLLRNEYRKKYDHAVTKCWTICVPCMESLREVSITKEFVDDHVLKPLPDSNEQFLSTDKEESHLYRIHNRRIQLINDGDENDECNVISIEKGYNKEYQPYNIIIVDKPVHRKYRVIEKPSEADKLQLNRSVSSYREAVDFLEELIKEKSCSIGHLEDEIEKFDVKRFESMEDLKESLQTLIRENWAINMRRQSLDVQRDARFQKLLSISLEIFIMHRLHDDVYFLLKNMFDQEDLSIRKKVNQLIDVGVSPDQLGVRDSLAVSLPSAMVELATLDTHQGPYEKLMCLKGTIDFIIAEIKGAIADVRSRNDSLNDSDNMLNNTCNVDTDDLISLLLYVIIKCRCQRLFTDLYYVGNFIWSISPHDGLSYTIVTFQAALTLLEQIDVKNLPKKSEKVKTELQISDFLRISQTDEIKTTLDRKLHNLAKRLGECMQTG